VRTPRALIALAVAVALVTTGVVSATAQAPAPRDPTKPCPGSTKPGCGDNYLESVPITLHTINKTLLGFSDSVDTSTATTQPDLFKPGGNRVGPAEQTTYAGKAYGKTVWYDLNPTVDGDVLVQAVGSDPVICLVRYDPRGAPNFPPVGPYECSNQGTLPLEQLLKKGVKRGRAYSIQIGGVGFTGGPLDVDVNFTPARVSATPKLALQLTPQGVKLLNVLVKASAKARVEVSCKPSCGKRVKRGRKVSLNYKKTLRPGSKLIVRVTRGGEIGAYFAYKIRKGKRPIETDRCLNPGSKKPRKTCP
jgi:hypothetical protein